MATERARKGRQAKKRVENLCNQYCFVPGNGAITFDCVTPAHTRKLNGTIHTHFRVCVSVCVYMCILCQIKAKTMTTKTGQQQQHQRNITFQRRPLCAQNMVTYTIWNCFAINDQHRAHGHPGSVCCIATALYARWLRFKHRLASISPSDCTKCGAIA